MKQNGISKIAILLFVILATAVVMAVVSLEKETPDSEKNTNNALQVSVVPINEKDGFYNIQVEYPQFESLETGFNQKISGLILDRISAFKKNAKDNWDARRATAPPDDPVPANPDTPFDFIASFTPTQLNNEYISFTADIYYFIGGAHGVTEINAFNYDVMKSKEITISDFLNAAPGALENLSAITSQAVTTQLEGQGLTIDDNLKQMIKDGTAPTPANYANFNFNYNSLIIYFEPYQVAPGYIGSVTITLFKDTLTQNSLRSDYLE